MKINNNNKARVFLQYFILQECLMSQYEVAHIPYCVFMNNYTY